MPQTSHLLFLDIDGVLNSVSSIIGTGHSYPRADPTEGNLDRVACGLVRRAAEQCGLTVCVHSMWANPRNADYLASMLRHLGCTVPTIPLPQASFDAGCVRRVKRIQTAIDHLEPESFVVVDDEDMTAVWGDRMILTDSDDGFRYRHYRRICELYDRRPGLVLM